MAKRVSNTNIGFSSMGDSLVGPGDGDKKKKTITVDSKNDPRYQAYKDSLNLYNYTELQKKLEPPRPQRSFLGFDLVGREKLETDVKNQKTLYNKTKEIIKDSPNIKYGIYGNISLTGEPYPDKTYKKILPRNGRELTVYSAHDSYARLETPSWDIHHPNIKPKSNWTGIAVNNDYSNVKPNVEVIVRDTNDTMEPSSQPQPRPKTTIPNVSNLIPAGIEIDTTIQGDLMRKRNKAPEIDHYKYSRSTTGFGANTTSGRTEDEQMLLRMYEQQERDELGGTSRWNKLKVTPIFKNKSNK